MPIYIIHKIKGDKMFIAFIFGLLAGAFLTMIILHLLSVITIRIVRTSNKNKGPKDPKSPFSDINLMDTKFKDCG